MSCLRRLALLMLLAFGASVPVSAQSTMLEVTSPQSDAVINQPDVTIQFQLNGFTVVPTTVPLAEAGRRPDANRPGEGHLHFMLDLQPVIVWEQNSPYTLQNVPAGEHELMVEVVNNDHSSLSPPVIQRIRFRTAMVMPATGQQDDSGAGSTELITLLAAVCLLVGGMFYRKNIVRARAKTTL